MKKSIYAGLLALTLAVSNAAPMLAAPLQAMAATTYTNIEGTIKKINDDGTKIYVNTDDGEMKIKLDSDTSYEYKVLLVGADIVMDLYAGSDGYLHASKIKSQDDYDDSTVYTNSQSTIVGKITSSTTDEDLYVYLKDSGTVQIKLTSSTDLSKVSYLVPNKYVSIVAAPASDGYLHAISISDVGSSSSTSSSTSSTTTTSAKTSTTTTVETPSGQIKVSGTVASGTTSSRILLSSTIGTYTIVVDSNTNTGNVSYTTVGKSIYVNVYRGDDAYLHAARIWTDSSSASSQTTSSTSTSTKTYSVSGTVASGTTDSKLYLQTDSGKYTFKIDNSSTTLSTGKSVKVTFYNGGDGYLHASAISAN